MKFKLPIGKMGREQKYNYHEAAEAESFIGFTERHEEQMMLAFVFKNDESKVERCQRSQKHESQWYSRAATQLSLELLL